MVLSEKTKQDFAVSAAFLRFSGPCRDDRLCDRENRNHFRNAKSGISMKLKRSLHLIMKRTVSCLTALCLTVLLAIFAGDDCVTRSWGISCDCVYKEREIRPGQSLLKKSFFVNKLDIRSMRAIVSISIYTYHVNQNNPVPRGQNKSKAVTNER